MDLPKISIITPSLNRAGMISGAIESVLSQSYPNFEHIVIDGGSTDETLEILARYPHLKLLSEPDHGMYEALNKGLKLASGEIVGFLNSDDLYAGNIFGSIAGCFRDQTSQAVVGRAIFFEQNKRGKHVEKMRLSFSPPAGLFKQVILGSCILNAWFFRTELCNSIGGFNPKYQISGDSDFILRLSLRGFKYILLDINTYQYRWHPNSLTMALDEIKLRRIIEDHFLYADNYLEDETVPHEVKILLNQLCLQTGEALLALYSRKKMYAEISGISERLKKYKPGSSAANGTKRAGTPVSAALYGISLISPATSATLTLEGDYWVSRATEERFPIVNGVSRFVPGEAYTESFGLQWNRFRQTQLDSYTGLPISRDRLTRIAGGSLSMFNGKNVLEAGCGAGRFTEIMLSSGANVWAVDLSSAVDANFENCHHFPGYSVSQADILALPFKPGQFDIVLCIGVIQHTPDPEKTIEALCSHVKPGGMLLVDHYTHGYPMLPLHQKLRTFLLQQRPEYRIPFVKRLVAWLWPFHRITYILRRLPVLGRMRSFWLNLSPVVDYQDAYPSLSKKMLYEWAILDTHDLLTDHYKHLRSAGEIASSLASYGMTDIVTQYAGNGVEARARKPVTG
jgi:2-polyprenyl-3-methyl-5-hydroxy-6-metoxy-1,4-benzoquinol methylase/GT2 family glycosyltransferase